MELLQRARVLLLKELDILLQGGDAGVHVAATARLCRPARPCARRRRWGGPQLLLVDRR